MSNSRTIEFFKEISKIPRESGNEAKISEYICEFARQRQLQYIKDKYNNVIIIKNTGKNEPIILQAHLDMVCEKENNLEFDFSKDSINVYEENGYLRAKGTTLGADNGIGVAQILNILDSDINVNIEAIFTVSEETTMIGAENIDVSILKGKKMINLDGFEEKTVILESASFFDIVLTTNYNFTEASRENTYKIILSGMPGGHSGFEIDKDNGNSSVELAKILQEIEDIEILDFVGGTKFNVIPSNAECIFKTKLNLECINEIVANRKIELAKKYKNTNIIVSEANEYVDTDNSELNEKVKIISNTESKHFIDAIISFKHGVFNKNENSEVTTSANLGIVNLKENSFKIGVRSSKKEEEKRILEYLREYSDEKKFKFEIAGMQPGFETNKESELISRLEETYKRINDDGKLKLKSVHITVEAGFFKDKIPDLEVAIISPKIIGAHTINECVEINSIIESDKWLQEFILAL